MSDTLSTIDRTPALAFSGVRFRYGDRIALDDVSFDVAPGTLHVLLGPNGSGKTTLFRLVSTLVEPQEGILTVAGADVRARPDAVRGALGVVFQSPALDDELTVEENLRVAGALYGLTGAELRGRIGGLLAALDLTDRTRACVSTLSGGLRRRVDLARGLLHRPRVLLLDEPTTALDPVARHTFWALLDRLRTAEGLTVLMATHLLEEADRADAVTLLHAGRVVAHGAPAALTEALGDAALWVETEAPDETAAFLHERGATVRAHGRLLHVSAPEAPALLTALYDREALRIESATLRRPSLADVFLVHTGQRLA